MSLSGWIYNAVFKRTSTFTLAIVFGALFFERGFGQGLDAVFESMNRGKLYPDVARAVKARAEAAAEAGDEDEDDE